MKYIERYLDICYKLMFKRMIINTYLMIIYTQSFFHNACNFVS